MIRSAIATVAVLLVGGAAIWLYAQHWHPSEHSYPFQGIDVSRHQGTIDWQDLPRQGVDFAYIKASEGGDFRDTRFKTNWRAAGGAGIGRGAYHFFTLCRSGADQAANFLAAVPSDSGALPPAVDLEFGGNCSARPTRGTLLQVGQADPALPDGRIRRCLSCEQGDRPSAMASQDLSRTGFREPSLDAVAGVQYATAQRNRRAGRLERRPA